jgi:hypothetical protein
MIDVIVTVDGTTIFGTATSMAVSLAATWIPLIGPLLHSKVPGEPLTPSLA